MLWKVRLSIRKKLALGGIFSITVIIMVFAIIRVVVITSHTEQPDQSWLYLWSSIEQTVCKSSVVLDPLRVPIFQFKLTLKKQLWLHASLPSRRSSRNLSGDNTSAFPEIALTTSGVPFHTGSHLSVEEPQPPKKSAWTT